MGLGFLAGFGAATLGLLVVAALVGWGVAIGLRHKRLSYREAWHDNGWLVAALCVATAAYVIAIPALGAG